MLVALPGPIVETACGIAVDFLIDGEAVSDTHRAFDLLEVKGHDVRDRGYQPRFAGLLNLLDPEGAIRPGATRARPHRQA